MPAKIKKATSPAAIRSNVVVRPLLSVCHDDAPVLHVRIRHFGHVLPLAGNLEPIFFVTSVGSTFGLFAAIRRLSSVLVSRTNSRRYGVGHFRDLIHTRRPTLS